MARKTVEWTAADLDLKTLLELGSRLDDRVPRCDKTVRELLAYSLLRIRDKDGRLRRMELNPAQKAFEARHGRRNLILKARQLGMTTWVAARFFVNAITQPGTVTVQVAHNQESAEQIFKIVHRFAENLPRALRQGALKTSRANARQLVFPRLDSEYRVESAADPNAGRGLTIRNLHGSEVARWPGDAKGTLASLKAGVTPDGEVTLESTPAGAAGCFYEEWKGATSSGYVQHFFPWWLEERYRAKGVALGTLTDEEEALVLRHGLDVEQIAFRRDMRANFGSRSDEEFAEDAETCFRSSGNCVFDVAKLDARMKDLPEPAEARDNGQLHVWWPAVRERRYVIGIDPAGGGSEGDYSCMQVVDRATGMQCAEWYGHCSPTELSGKAAALGREYNGALLVVERNNHGHAVLAQLETVERYEPLYRQSGRLSGWTTTVLSRPQLLENLAACLVASPELFSSVRLLRECKTFVRREDSRVAAAQGCHDDAIFAMALALAVRGRLGK